MMQNIYCYRRVVIPILAAAGLVAQPAVQAQSAEAPQAVLQPAARPPAQQRQLSLQACIEQALKANPTLQAQRLQPRISQLERERLLASFGLVAGAETRLNQNVSPSNLSFIEGAAILNQVRQNYNLFLNQDLASGGSLRLGFDNSILDTNSARADLNPAFTPRLALNISHPLLRNTFNGLRELEIRFNDQTAAEWQYKDQAIQTVAEVQDAYWSLVLFRERLQVLEQSLGILENLLEMNREKEKAGFMSRIDVLQTEATIAARRASLLDARRNLENTEDRLKQLLNPQRADLDGEAFIAWDAELVPSDQPVFELRSVALQQSLQAALDARPDYHMAQLALANSRLREEISGQNRLPELNFQGSSGLESLSDNYTQALGELFSLRTYFWSVGLSFELPVIGNPFEAAYAQAQVQREQQSQRLLALEQQMLRELRQAVRNVEMTGMQVEATRLAKRLAEEQLKAQTEKLNLGLTTNFQVLQFQSDFESASLAEVNAIVAYIQAVNQLQQAEGTLIEALGIELAAL